MFVKIATFLCEKDSTAWQMRELFAVKNISQRQIASVDFQPADYDEMAKKYNPATLSYGFNTLAPDGEEVFFIPNPALGLWINREAFTVPEL